MIRKIKILTIVLLAGLLAWIAMSSAKESKKEMVSAVKFNIEDSGDEQFLLKESDLVNLLGGIFEKDFVGMTMEETDLNIIEEIIQSDPFVRDTKVYIDAKNVLHIDVMQRKAIVRLKTIQGEDYYLDEEGVKLPLSIHFTPRVPVVIGHIEPYQADWKDSLPDSRLNQVYEIANFIRKDHFLDAIFESMVVAMNGEIKMYPKLGNFYIKLNDINCIQAKFDNLKVFLQNGLNKSDWTDLEYVDLTYNKQVVVKRRKTA